jgi:peptidylprolyl isomerase
MSDSPNPPRTCVNGHQIAEGNQFCTECGSEAAPGADSVCENGHPVQAGNLFCPTCGSAIASPEPAPSGVAPPPAPGLPLPPELLAPPLEPSYPSPPDPATPTNRPNFLLRKTKTGIPGWVMVVSPVLVLIVVGAMINQSQHTQASSTAQSPSPVASCGNNLTNWIIFEYNFGNQGPLDAVNTFGVQSAIVRWLIDQQSPFNSNVTSDGQSSAVSSLVGPAIAMCAWLASQGVPTGQIPGPPSSVSGPVPLYSGKNPQDGTGGGPCSSQQLNSDPGPCFTSGGGSTTATTSASISPVQNPSPVGTFGTKPTVTPPTGTPPTGLESTDLITGTGPAVASASTVTVQYVGIAWSTGEQFDASWNDGSGQPVSFPLTGVIPGWAQGMVGMKVGGRRELVIPPNLAYGATPPQGSSIGVNDTLVFIIDLVKIG